MVYFVSFLASSLIEFTRQFQGLLTGMSADPEAGLRVAG